MKYNVIEEAKKELTESLEAWGKLFAQYALEEKDYMIDHSLKRMSIKKFLLNLVTAYDTNITPYLPKEKEEAGEVSND